ncbi:MAG: hypothetical protein Q4E89_02510 [Eubacteriales bacterium]|nr:hypothetical protein [Eubacteriales bacterium]
MADEKKKDDSHLDVYLDRYVLHQNDVVTTYYEGFQNAATQQRYEKINTVLANGYLYDVMKELPDVDFTELSENNKVLLKRLVNGITSEVGRALVGVAFLQLTIKSIAPDQSIRLHKGTTRRGSFSWVDGISMRTIDSTYSTPFLREQGLLNVNKFGVFMTRSLAENYPYSKLYKAEMRGPFTEWIDIVDAIEDESMPAKQGLYYLMAQLKNKSDAFNTMADEVVSLANAYKDKTFAGVSRFMKGFFNETEYSARAFEIVIHGFMQAMSESHMLGDLDLSPMSQMRSANKKHGNIGDVELKDGRVIVEAWDAKYGKPYLRDELEELRDKILTSLGVKVAGFIADSNVDRRKDVMNRAEEISLETGVDIFLFSFDEWLEYQTKRIAKPELDRIASRWLIAVVESFAQRRLEMAPIDEPCEAWVQDLISKLK